MAKLAIIYYFDRVKVGRADHGRETAKKKAGCSRTRPFPGFFSAPYLRLAVDFLTASPMLVIAEVEALLICSKAWLAVAIAC